jgi:hypothetical protein
MISRAEIRYALLGLTRILRFDPSFLQFYDRSRSGALRSFWIYLPLLVLAWLQLKLLHDPQQPPLTDRMWLSLMIAHVINVMYFPLILLSIGNFINREAQVIGCITVYNWLSLLSIILTGPLTLLAWIDINHLALLILIYLSRALSFICEGYVLAVCLQVSGLFAIAFVALDYVVGEMLFSFAELLAKAPLF